MSNYAFRESTKPVIERLSESSLGCNLAAPDLAPIIRQARQFLDQSSLVHASNPVIRNLRNQVEVHLRHISLSYQIEDDNYPLDLVMSEPYPRKPSMLALKKMDEFREVLENHAYTQAPKIGRNEALEKDLLQEQKDYVQTLTKSPYDGYLDLRARLENSENAPFPEFAAVINYLKLKMCSDPTILKLSSVYEEYDHLRSIVYKWLTDMDDDYGYSSSVDAIQRAVEFLDITVRIQSPTESPVLFHSHRYEYYSHYLKSCTPEHILLPTLVSLGASDILKIRGVPVGMIGINTDIVAVDGFNQTPYEFWCHDINHSRRMFLFFKRYARSQGLSSLEFSKRSNKLMQEELIPLFTSSPHDDEETRNKKRMIKMLLFEVHHEDAQPLSRDMLRNAIYLRPHGRAPTERIEGDSITYSTLPGASTLSYLYRKLVHEFYDAPKNRNEHVVGAKFRQRKCVADAAETILTALGFCSDRELLDKLVNTDQRYTIEVYDSFTADINSRPGEAEPLRKQVPVFTAHEEALLCESLFKFNN